jgi:hypothetical protein
VGYRKIPTIYTLDEIKGEPGLVVRMKTISFGKVRRLLALMDSDTNDSEVMGEISSQLVANLVSWNLEKEDGTVWPETLESIDEQEYELVLGMVNAWLDKITGTSEELGKDSSSGEKFPGQLPTMEAL